MSQDPQRVRVILADGLPHEFSVGREYVLTTRFNDQKIDRSHRMGLISVDDDKLWFDTRPVGGTVWLPSRVVKSAEDVGISSSQNHELRYVNRSVNPVTRGGGKLA